MPLPPVEHFAIITTTSTHPPGPDSCFQELLTLPVSSLLALKQLKRSSRQQACHPLQTESVPWAREMAQQLRALTTLVEDPGLVPSVHMMARICLELQFQGLTLSTGLVTIGTRGGPQNL